MRGHSYKNRRGSYYRGRSRTGRYYTRSGCLIQVLLIIAALIFIMISGCSIDSSDYNSNPSAVMSEETHTGNDNTTNKNNSADITKTSEPSPNLDMPQESVESQEPVKPQEPDTIENSTLSGRLEISFLDVGQADSILITQDQFSMLVDAGNNADADQVVNYLKSKGINKLDYVIGTHPHEDHIGGLDAAINSFEIDKILMPKQLSTTKTFEDVLVAIQNKNMKVTTPKVGDVYNLGRAKWTILGPNKEKYEDVNNSSIVIRLTFGSNSFLFMGDAEELSEREISSNDHEIKSDLIKIGHHGSSSSTSQEFLKKVSPKHAIVSVGAGNDYGHPHTEVLGRLNDAGVSVYRTDAVGTIIVASDGTSITIDKKASPIKENAPPPAGDESSHSVELTNSNTVYVTDTGEKYHNDGCRYLSKSRIPIDLDLAIASGYAPCSVCNPDTKIGSTTTTYSEDVGNKSSTPKSSTEDKKEITVYITKTGAKYHTAGCSYLKKSSIPIELANAIGSGYTPCSRCSPPR